MNGQPGLQLTYNVTDGGPLDEDGLANGVIVDPVGLAAVPTTSTLAPDTGYGSPASSRDNLIVAVLAGSVACLALGLRARRRNI